MLGMKVALPFAGIAFCAALMTSISCKLREEKTRTKDAVESSNAMFGTGRSAGTRAAKRNCFKSGIFSEDPNGARPSGENDSGSASSESSTSAASAQNRLIKTRINQMNEPI